LVQADQLWRPASWYSSPRSRIRSDYKRFLFAAISAAKETTREQVDAYLDIKLDPKTERNLRARGKSGVEKRRKWRAAFPGILLHCVPTGV